MLMKSGCPVIVSPQRTTWPSLTSFSASATWTSSSHERGGELPLQVAPGEPLDLDRDVRVRLLVLRGHLVQDREGLQLGLGLPEPDDLLVGRLSEGDGEDEDQRGERGGESASSDHGEPLPRDGGGSVAPSPPTDKRVARSGRRGHSSAGTVPLKRNFCTRFPEPTSVV